MRPFDGTEPMVIANPIAPFTSYESVTPGAEVTEMYSVMRMREFRPYFLLHEKVSQAIDLLADITSNQQIDGNDFKYLYATDIRPIIRTALEDMDVKVTTTSVIFPDPVEDASYIKLSEGESSWGSGKTVQTIDSCTNVRNFIRGIAIHLANLAYTPYPDVEFLKRQSAEISAFKEKFFPQTK